MGTAPALKIVQVAPQISPGDQFEVQFVGTLSFWDRPQKGKKINDKFEAPQGLRRSRTLNKVWIVVETPRNRSEIDRNRFVSDCPGIWGLVSSGLGADLDPKSTISGRILKNSPGHFSSAEECVYGVDFGRVLHRSFAPDLFATLPGPSFIGGSLPQGHLPRLISDTLWLVLFHDPGSEE